jgi:hypothetical protein
VQHAHPVSFEIAGDAVAADRFREVGRGSIFAGEKAVGEAVEGKDREAVAQRCIA